MNCRSRGIISFLVGILATCLLAHWALGYVGGPIPNPWKYIWNWAGFIGALVSQNINHPSPFGAYPFLIFVFSTLAYVVLWILERIVARVARVWSKTSLVAKGGENGKSENNASRPDGE
jgi:hypothetical protein